MSSSTIDTDNVFDASSNNNTPETENTETITTATTSNDNNNIDEIIVESLYNNDETYPEQLIGYSCKQVLKQNTVEIMDLIFYMDVLSPIIITTTNGQQTTTEKQFDELNIIQAEILKDIAIQYQIDPTISKGLRCFDLPVDGSTWIVELYIDPTKDFNEISLFGKFIYKNFHVMHALWKGGYLRYRVLSSAIISFFLSCLVFRRNIHSFRDLFSYTMKREREKGNSIVLTLTLTRL
jgi:hypothetical protein